MLDGESIENYRNGGEVLYILLILITKLIIICTKNIHLFTHVHEFMN